MASLIPRLLIVAMAGAGALLVPVPALQAYGQAAAAAAKVVQASYSAEPVVFERLDTVYRYHNDGTGTKTEITVVRLQSEAALRAFSVVRLPYDASSSRVELVSVRVRKPNGSVVNTPVADTADQVSSLAQAAPLYSDLHVAVLPVRGLAVGDRLEYQVRTVTIRPDAKDEFWGAESFGRGAVVLERSIEVRVPAAKSVQVICPKNPAATTTEGDERVFRWVGAQTEPTVHAPQAPSADEAAQPTTPPITWTTFRSWGEVGDWYRTLTAASLKVTPALQSRADGLVFGLASQKARVEALYSFVEHEVRSIQVPSGQELREPHPAGDILSNQYGDSKDKAALLVALLRAERIPAALALVGADLQSEPAAPSPGWFQQVLVVAGEPGPGRAWLDLESEIAPPRYLPAPLRGSVALVVPAAASSALERAPADLPFPAQNRFEAVAKVTSDGTLAGHIALTLRGDEEMRFRQGLRNLNAAQWDRLSEAYLRQAGLGGTASNTVADLPEVSSMAFHLGFDVQVAPSALWEGFRLTAPEPVLTLPFANRRSSPDRDIPLGGKRTDTAVSRLTLPPNFSADLPRAAHVHTPFADFDRSYLLDRVGTATVVTTERTLTIKQDRLPATEWAAYRGFLDAVAENPSVLQLTSTSGSGAHRPPAAGEDVAAAAALVEQAGAAIARKDWATASTLLDQARGLNPRQPRLWSSYGTVAEATGKPDEAIADDRRELDAHPEAGAVSQRLAALLVARGEVAAADTVLEQATEANPENVPLALQLAKLQSTLNPGKAEATLRASLARAPESTEVQLALGKLLIREGKKPQGTAFIAAVASNANEAGELNDAAYTLADAGVELPLAEAASRRAVQLLNQASARGQGGMSLGQSLRFTLQVLATWDTYGWVLFKEGNTSEAEPWLRAAWLDGYGAAAGRHYSLALRALGRTAEAEHVQHLALLAPQDDEGAAGFTAGGRQPGHLAGASREGGSNAMLSERSLPFRRSTAGGAGTASFALLQSPSGLAKAQFLSGDPGLASLEPALAKVELHSAFPSGTPVVLTRRGTLRCGAGAVCTLEILPAQTAATLP